MFGGASETFIQIKDVAANRIFARQTFNAVPYALKVSIDASLEFNAATGQLGVAPGTVDGQILTWSGGTWHADAGSGAVIGPGDVTNAMLAGSIDESKLSAGIPATKVGGGSVDNAEFGRLDGVTSGIQTQLDAITSQVHSKLDSPGAGPANALVVDATGKIGIGTTTPGSRLEIRGSGTTAATSSLNVTDSSGASKLFVADDGAVAIGKSTPRVPIDFYDDNDPANTPTNGTGVIFTGGIVELDGLQDMTAGASGVCSGGACGATGGESGGPLMRGEANRWENAPTGATYTIDIGRIRPIKAIAWGTYWKSSASSNFDAYKIEYSTDGVSWTVWQNVTANNRSVTLHYLANGTSMRFVRITNTGSGPAWISTIQVLGYAEQNPFTNQPWGFTASGSITGNDIVARTIGNVGIGTSAPGQKLTVDGTVGILEGGITPTKHTIFQGGDQSVDVNLPVTLTGTPAFSGAFALSYAGGASMLYGNTFSGAATGVRYSAAGNGVIYTNGAAGTYFPGNSAGSTGSGGQYY